MYISYGCHLFFYIYDPLYFWSFPHCFIADVYKDFWAVGFKMCVVFLYWNDVDFLVWRMFAALSISHVKER